MFFHRLLQASLCELRPDKSLEAQRIQRGDGFFPGRLPACAWPHADRFLAWQAERYYSDEAHRQIKADGPALLPSLVPPAYNLHGRQNAITQTKLTGRSRRTGPPSCRAERGGRV